MTEVQARPWRAPCRRLRQEALDPPQVYVPSPGDLVRATHGNGIVHTVHVVEGHGQLLLACGDKRQMSNLRPLTAVAPFRECDRCAQVGASAT